MTAREKAIKRIKGFLENQSLNDCVIGKPLNTDGYVEFQLRQFADGKKYHISGHRLSYEMHNNDSLTSNDVICHKCDNPACINPKHLFKGTHNDNVQDKVKKFRQAKAQQNGRFIHGRYSKYM